MDWTYDRYLEDVKKYEMKDTGNLTNYNEYFICYVKRAAAKFLEKWKQQHDGKLYDHGYVGDAFAANLLDWFSDFYKDTYNQRPHLPIWFYVHPLGLPMLEDTARLFCADPMGQAAEAAKAARESF